MPMDTPYWNPRTETLPREQLDALQLRKLRDLVAWTLAKRAVAGRRLREAGVRAEDIASLDDIRRIPFMTRDDWMESQIADPPFGEVLAAAARGGDPLPHDLRHDRQPPARGARRPEGLGVDRGDVVLRALGLRRPPRRQRVLRLQLRDVRRLLGRALRRREARLPRPARAAT